MSPISIVMATPGGGPADGGGKRSAYARPSEGSHLHSAAVRRGDVGVVNWRRGQRRSCLAGKEVINKVVFIDQGLRIEEAETAECFRSPKHKRTKLFLSKILI